MKTLELFAGIGGFRVGLEKADKTLFEVICANQFEPTRKNQDAFEIYDFHYPNSENLNIDIAKISDEKLKTIKAELIVAGFPCQDYSVALSNKNKLGIEGKKGVLFWQIIRAVENIKPKFLILENVDRLLKSPPQQRGRDFAIMLKSFSNLDYALEWRVINAADYGMAQKRKRVFFFICQNKLLNNKIKKLENLILKRGFFSPIFPVKTIEKDKIIIFKLPKNIIEISNKFSANFLNTGIMYKNKVLTVESKADYNHSFLSLADILEPDVLDYLNEQQIKRFKYLRGAKKELRTKNGFNYFYSEGKMSDYDDINLPARTILTSEGRIARSSHLLKINNNYRLLTPIEAERLLTFPDNWTKYKKQNGIIKEVSKNMRFFCLGNSLITEIIEKIALRLKEIWEEELIRSEKCYD